MSSFIWDCLTSLSYMKLIWLIKQKITCILAYRNISTKRRNRFAPQTCSVTRYASVISFSNLSQPIRSWSKTWLSREIGFASQISPFIMMHVSSFASIMLIQLMYVQSFSISSYFLDYFLVYSPQISLPLICMTSCSSHPFS